MLAGDDAVHLAAFVEAFVERKPSAGIGAVVARAVPHQAGHAIPKAELIGGDGLAIAAAMATQQLRLGTHLNPRPWDRPDAGSTLPGDFDQQACLQQRCDHQLQGFFLLLAIQLLCWFEGSVQPMLRPGERTAVAGELLEVALAAIAGDEAGLGCRWPEAWGVEDAVVEHKCVGAAAE